MSLVWNFSFEADFCISKLFSAVAIIFFVSEIEGKKKSLKKVFLWKKERKKERKEWGTEEWPDGVCLNELLIRLNFLCVERVVENGKIK